MSRRLVINGTPRAVRAVVDVLCPMDDEDSTWLVLTDEGSSTAALVRQAEAMRQFQSEATRPADIAFAFPTTEPPEEFLAAWEGSLWDCRRHLDRPCGIMSERFLQIHDTWAEAVAAMLEQQS